MSQPAVAPDVDAPVAAEPAARQKIREFEVVVERVIWETHDTVTLVYFNGKDCPGYKAGQFVSIRPHQFPALASQVAFYEDTKGKREPARAYSLTSAPHEKALAITIKEELYVKGETKYPPLLSPFLVYSTPPGTRMVVSGIGGPYALPDDIADQTDHLIHICAGSGIVPNYSILKDCLENGSPLRHTMLYGNKTWKDIIFRDQLNELAALYPEKFTLVHSLSRECPHPRYGAHCRQGRVGLELIREFVPDADSARVFTCGPGIGPFERQAAREKGEAPKPRFLEGVIEALDAAGVPKKHVHRESYG
jgi:3-ketosteroid 9alpha-monooxygenase subunit B